MVVLDQRQRAAVVAAVELAGSIAGSMLRRPHSLHMQRMDHRQVDWRSTGHSIRLLRYPIVLLHSRQVRAWKE